MSHTAGGQTMNYAWDVNAGLPEVLQDGTNTYVYGLGRISATDSSGNQAYYTGDGLGSTTDLTDSSATKTDGYPYDAFGAATHTPGSSANPFQFTGQQTDADASLQYLRARYYDPSVGRFLGRDPLGVGNRYSYVSNNPADFGDPYGLIDCGFFSDVCDEAVGVAEDVVTDTANTVINPVKDVLSANWSGVITDIPNLVSIVDYLPYEIGPVDWASWALNEISLFAQCSGWQLWVGSALNTANLGVGVGGVLIASGPATAGTSVAVIATVVAAEFLLNYATNEVQEHCTPSIAHALAPNDGGDPKE